MAGRVFRGNAEIEITADGRVIINPESGQEIDASGADLQNVGALEAGGSKFRGQFSSVSNFESVATEGDWGAIDNGDGTYYLVVQEA